MPKITINSLIRFYILNSNTNYSLPIFYSFQTDIFGINIHATIQLHNYKLLKIDEWLIIYILKIQLKLIWLPLRDCQIK